MLSIDLYICVVLLFLSYSTLNNVVDLFNSLLVHVKYRELSDIKRLFINPKYLLPYIMLLYSSILCAF